MKVIHVTIEKLGKTEYTKNTGKESITHNSIYQLNAFYFFLFDIKKIVVV